MAAKQHFGLEGLLRATLEKKSKKELIEENLQLLLQAGKILIELKEFQEQTKSRNQAGALAKAKEFIPDKVMAAEMYIELRHSHMKVSAQKLLDALNEKYPGSSNRRNYNTLRGWHKAFKEALAEKQK